MIYVPLDVSLDEDCHNSSATYNLTDNGATYNLTVCTSPRANSTGCQVGGTSCQSHGVFCQIQVIRAFRYSRAEIQL